MKKYRQKKKVEKFQKQLKDKFSAIQDDFDSFRASLEE